MLVAGNGLCSLAELEMFIKMSLLRAFPPNYRSPDRKTPGDDVFKAFRHCYIRAFKDAVEVARNDDKAERGTKSLKNDLVTREQFRFFCAFVCIYGCMVRGLELFHVILFECV